MLKFRLSILASAFAALAFVAPAPAQPPAALHPLDPLTWQEHWAVLKLLSDEGKLTGDTRFTRLALKSPDKNAVWAWKPGEAFTREAEIIIREGRDTFEATADLRANKITAWAGRPGVEQPWLNEEYNGQAVYEAQSSRQFQEALRKRGVKYPEFVSCSANPRGNLGEKKYEGRRIGIIACSQPADVRNATPRDVGGLNIVVDMNSGEVLEFLDEESAPLPATAADYDLKSLQAPRGFPAPIEISQPQGAGFKLNGKSVEWDRWRFHLRSDQRAGLIVSTVTWRDGETARPVLYEGHLSEIFVPYMAPQQSWASRNHLDAGENSAGGLSDTLEPGVHCPSNAVYFDAIVVEDEGLPKDKRRVACLFERHAGEVTWLHGEEGRLKRSLVVRMSAKAGNYDYLIDWVFKTDGEIRVDVGATGILGVKSSAAKNASDAKPGEELYGRFVDDNLIGVNHSHFFNFRFDLDVDGPANAFIMDEMRQIELPENNPRRSLWVSEPRIAAREHDALNHGAHGGHPMWRIASASRKNKQGYATSYQIMPGKSGHGSFLAEDDIARRRAGFIDHDLWVTPHNPDELYAAGKYATLSKPGEGLPAWTAQNREIKDRDIVAWHTIGMHHVVRSEDWPVMPTLTHSVSLRPFDFFDRNPAIETDMKP